MVLLVYALHPAVQSLNLDGFHPETLAVPFLIGAGYFGLSQHWRRFALCCVLAMLCRADLGLAVAGLGVLIMVQGYRRRGAITLVVGLVWAFGFLLVVQPHLGDSVSQLQAYAAFGDTPGSILWGMLTHPVELFTQASPGPTSRCSSTSSRPCCSCRSCRRATCCRCAAAGAVPGRRRQAWPRATARSRWRSSPSSSWPPRVA